MNDTNPKRIQRKRTKGWRMPEGAVSVTRPGRWGNPFVAHFEETHAAEKFAAHLKVRANPHAGWIDLLSYPSDQRIREELAGKDLACWCPLDQPCHADVLLAVANEATS